MDRFIIFVTNHPILVGLFALFAILLVILESRKNGRSISNNELTHYVNNEQALIIDLRDNKEFKAGHITNALNIPKDQLNDRLSELKKHKEKPIILVCKHGNSSGVSSHALQKAGFSQILRLKGGVQNWEAENLPLIKK